MGRYRILARRAAVAGYAAYKWLESHADEVERWADKAATKAVGTRAERVVTPPAKAVKRVARWIQDERSGDKPA
ncbi:MAG: hypothetical protein M3161_05590 [Actinomycetota bacterium]|nr:hypothetical protein [Actinomycetota bacterium]